MKALTNRWMQYQRERFPLGKYALLVASFCICGLSLSYQLTGRTHPVTTEMFVVAFVVTLLTFLLLRAADEHKDELHDRLHHPQRPVPRGLITLEELRRLAMISSVVQLGAALSLSVLLVIPLLCTWAYLILMTREFFLGNWLRARPILYMVSHMCILFFTDFFITSCHWLTTARVPPVSLLLFLGTSFFLGLVIEIGRKTRCPDEETTASDTYTSRWGIRTTVIAWLSAVTISACLAAATALQVHSLPAASMLLTAVFLACFQAGRAFLRSSSPESARRIDSLSGVWTLTVYLSMGVVPLLFAYLPS